MSHVFAGGGSCRDVDGCSSQVTIANIIITKMFEILGELLKCDIKIQSEHVLLEKWHQQSCWIWGCHRPKIHEIWDICEAQ